ncbi:uncharacterized protein ACN2A1_012390 isoform 1-T1 [Glossina fuscipes fuscipes]
MARKRKFFKISDKPEINCSKSQTSNSTQFEEQHQQQQQVTETLRQSSGGIVYQANDPMDFHFTKIPKNSSKLFFIKTYRLLDNREHQRHERQSHCEEKGHRIQKSSNMKTDFVHKSTIIMEVEDKTQTLSNNSSTLSMACGMKRESFLRHSLQTLRRSFTSKKSLKPIDENCAAKHPIPLPSQSPILNQSHIPNLYISTTTLASGLVITLNSNLNAKNDHSLKTSEKTVVKKRASVCNNYPIAVTDTSFCTGDAVMAISENNENNCHLNRSTSSVSTIEQNFPNSTIVATTTPITSLHNHAGTQSVLCLSAFEKDLRIQPVHKPQQSHQHRNKRLFQQQLSTPIEGVITNSPASASGAGDYSSARSLKHNNNSTRLGQLVNVPSEVSLRSISPSRRSASSNSSSTAKHEHSSTAATAATGSSAAAAVSTSSSTTPPEKEKKRKEVSSSRVKKFHRHFSQVSKDEKLINYFSCALVSDILLQGHLYITDKHFAFYSNVFGYVTKVVIPTSSVTKISKEKTAKIIPNAVGVATADERHVFGSFISREAAFRLMCSVCPPLAPAVALLPKDPASIEISEEYSIEDDSSCSVSGNESPAQTNENGCNVNSMAAHKDSSQTLLRHTITNSNLSIVESSAQQRHSDIPLNAKTAVFSASSANLHTHIAGSRISAPIVANLAKTTSNVGGGVGSSASNKNKSSLTFSQPTACTASLTVLPSSSTAEANVTFIAGTASTTTSATSTPTPSTSSSPTTVQAKPSTSIQKALQTLRTFTKTTMLRIRYPRELHVVYMGVMLTLVLTVFTIFLLYRILDIEAKTSIYRLPNEFNWRSGNDDDIFAEALRFQNELEHKSTEEAQNILRANLEQIAKVRRSLETLSMLIHDRGSTFDSHHHYVNRDDTN